MSDEIQFKLTSYQPDLFGLWGAQEELAFEAGAIRIQLRDAEEGQDHSSVARAFEASVNRELSLDDSHALIDWHERLDADPERQDGESAERFSTNFSSTHLRWQQGEIEPNLKRMFSTARQGLQSEVERISSWITWRYNLIPAEALYKGVANDEVDVRRATLEYRLSDDDWRLAPGEFGWTESRELGGAAADEITGEEHAAIQAEMNDPGQQAPLAWTMFQRALRSAQSDPRVSLVLAVAAAEIAIKQCLAALDRSPIASWILIDEQAPSWSKLVKEPLGLLTTRRVEGTNRVLPKTITAPIESALNRRNQFVHRGATEFEENELESLLQAVNDFLYALEWLKGNEWALEKMSARSRREWGCLDSK